MNVAAKLAAFDGLDSWENACMDLADRVLCQYPEAQLLWVEPVQEWGLLPGTDWQYHAVIILDGVVHDAWHPEAVLPPEEYVAEVFGEGRWEINPGTPGQPCGVVLKKH